MFSSSTEIFIRISDNGCGIPEAVLDQLGVEEVTFGKPDGHGIGFKEASEYIKAMNGRIEVRSKQNLGTHLTIILPRQAPPLSFVKLTNHDKRILLLDDDPIIREGWRSKGRKLGIEVIIVSTEAQNRR